MLVKRKTPSFKVPAIFIKKKKKNKKKKHTFHRYSRDASIGSLHGPQVRLNILAMYVMKFELQNNSKANNLKTEFLNSWF